MNEDDSAEVGAWADKVLEKDPGNPIARYVAWQAIEDDDESAARIYMLEESVKAMKAVVDRRPDDMSEDMQLVYASMLSDLASYMYLTGRKDEAMEIAEEFKKYDIFGNIPGRLVYYATIIEKYDFNRIIEELENEEIEDMISEYCRAIALYELDKGNVADASNALLDAISLAPDMIFYILGMWDVDDIEPEGFDEDEFDCSIGELELVAVILSDLWSAEDDRLAFLGHVAFALGYLTDRITDKEEIEMLESSYDDLDIFFMMSESRDKLRSWGKSGRGQSEVDEEAIQVLREMSDVGLFRGINKS
ncbi:MAG: hypothetical protein LBO21_08290 [Synergistaceae bacterium]|jgi:tetratricopeptide (TPR) repeat protein|nr:hypothetical protein [Synergistaceae bacterium]